MSQNDKDFSHKSVSYRKNYSKAINALYGEKLDIPLKPLKKRKVKRKIDPMSEGYIQVKLVQWAKSEGLDLISIPNHGKRSSWRGRKEVAMGLTKGVSDLFLTHMRNGYGGYWIELKSKGKKPTSKQHAWLIKKAQDGYKTDWFDDFDKAKNAIEEYLGIS